MVDQLISPLYFLYEPREAHVEPTAYEVTTSEGINEVAQLVTQRTGHVRLIGEDEFRGSIEVGRVTDDCTKHVGMAWNTEEDSVFYVYVR